MEKLLLSAKILVTTIGAAISAKLGILGPILTVLSIMMVLDYITGMLASKKESIEHPNDKSYGWSSKKGAQGIIKKIAYICIVAVAMVVDYIIGSIAATMGIAVGVKAFFALLTSVWYILNELLSIIENAGRMGAAVPEWLKKNVAALKDTIDHKADNKKE